MSVEEIKEYYDFILPLVLEAGNVLLDAKNIKGENKNGVDWDWVTTFDKKIEALFNSKIKQTYPQHQFIGEESTKDEIELGDDPTWIIDPIDGTENFIRQLRLSCISVGMTISKEQVFGIVYNPYMNELFTAIRGQGAYLNGEKISVSTQKDYTQSFFNYEISMARVGEYFYNLYMFRLKHLIPKVMSLRSFGCAALGLCYVACGRTDAYQCDGLFTWDAAAGTLIVREAGGYVVDSSGKKFDLLKPNFLATATKELADQYLAIEREADLEMKNSDEVELRMRQQKPGENLQEFGADIERLTRSYPAAPSIFLDQLSVQQFIEGVRDSEMKCHLRLTRPSSANNALIRALEYEASRMNTGHKVRRVDVQEEPQANAILQQLLDEKREFRRNMDRNADLQKSRSCFNCGRMGHFKRDCRVLSRLKETPPRRQSGGLTHQPEN